MGVDEAVIMRLQQLHGGHPEQETNNAWHFSENDNAMSCYSIRYREKQRSYNQNCHICARNTWPMKYRSLSEHSFRLLMSTPKSHLLIGNTKRSITVYLIPHS